MEGQTPKKGGRTRKALTKDAVRKDGPVPAPRAKPAEDFRLSLWSMYEEYVDPAEKSAKGSVKGSAVGSAVRSAETENENAKGNPKDVVIIAKPERLFSESEAEFLKLGLFLSETHLHLMGNSKCLLAFLILLLILFSIGSGAVFGFCLGRNSCFCFFEDLY